MSIRGTIGPLVFLLSVMLAWTGAVLASEPESTEPAPEKESPAARKTGQPAAEKDGGVEIGAVQRALRHLYTLPRPRSASGRPSSVLLSPDERVVEAPASPVHRSGEDRMGLQHYDAINNSRPSEPIGSESETNRLGLQHYDAIHNSRSSVPIGGELEPHRLGLQHDDAIRHSNSDLPIGAGERTDRYAPRAMGDRVVVKIGPGIYYYPRPQVSYSDRDWINYRYYNGRPGQYGYGIHDEFGDTGAGDVYRFGFNQGYDAGRFASRADERTERIISYANSHLDRGLRYFREGRYRPASSSFRLAAESNQGDPAARLYAAHALFATGRYRDAVKYLHRAFELQPKIAYLVYDIRDDYGRRAEFDEHLADLVNAVNRSPGSVDRLTLLGYVHCYSNRPGDAYEPLVRAKRLAPDDRLVLRLLEVCEPPDVLLDERGANEAKRPERSTPSRDDAR
jgi:hypothetical protein